MAVIKAEIRTGVYYDFAFLMQLQRNLSDLPGVEDAGVIMGTESNKELLAHINLVSPEVDAAKPDDLVAVVRADNEKQHWLPWLRWKICSRKRKQHPTRNHCPKALNPPQKISRKPVGL